MMPITSSNFKGLTDEEVKQNRIKYGTNNSGLKSKNKFWEIAKNILTEPLFVLLIFAACIYFLLGQHQEGIVMLIAICFVSGISLYQENKSQVAVDSLKKLSSPTIKVIRNGNIGEIKTDLIVVHDLLFLEDGNIVPADAKVKEAHDFTVNESILTGESIPVSKEEKEPQNVIFQGTLVMSGSCIAEVSAIGNATALGKIGQSLVEIETVKTPLQIQIRSFVRSMIGAGAIAFIVVWGLNFYWTRDVLHSLLHGLTLAMSILPEEIPVAFSTFMALGAYYLYKKNVIAKSPHTVETLGAATVICMDKTGTITENSMQISAVYDFSDMKTMDYTKEKLSYNPVLEYAMWASETIPFDNMEKSIHQAYSEVVKEDRRPDFKMIHEYPLEGKPPIMTHVFSDDKTHIIAAKGSVEGILNQCELSAEQKASIQKKSSDFAARGYRILAVAKSTMAIEKLPESQQEIKFELLGLLAFYDPPKANIVETVQQFYRAGIAVKMITGDYPGTAMAISNQIKLKEGSGMLTGNEVTGMSMRELQNKVKETTVFARMFPEAKLKVIEALKANGEIVAMTGDGVNDGPALKAAHIGIAMALRGSEIAKAASALILMDDDVAHMVDAVALGRRIYENLKKAIRYIISIHVPIILIVILPLLFYWKFTDIFSPIHVIFLELIMGPTCSIVFENEPIESNSMSKMPRKRSDTLFAFRELLLSILQGLLITLGCLGLGYYFIQSDQQEDSVRTIIYTTLLFSNVLLTLVNRSFHFSILTTIRYKNKLVPLVTISSLIVLFLSIRFQPLRNLFQFSALAWEEVALSFGVALACVGWVEILKFFKRRRLKNKEEEWKAI